MASVLASLLARARAKPFRTAGNASRSPTMIEPVSKLDRARKVARASSCRCRLREKPSMTLRTLLVDDEPPARDRLRRLLSGHSDVEVVGEAGNVLEALEKIDELRPDILFLDIQMPEMDGLEVAASMPDTGPAVVFTTAFDAHAIRAFELAAVDYLLKPVAKDRLRASRPSSRRITMLRFSSTTESSCPTSRSTSS